MDAFEGRTSPPPPPLLTLAICSYTCFLMRSDDPLFKEADVERDKVCALLIEKSNTLVRREYLTPRISTIVKAPVLVLILRTPPTLFAIGSLLVWL